MSQWELVNGSTHTTGGWNEVTPAVLQWADSADYVLPKGAMLVGMDCEEIALGVQLFESPDVRWDTLSGRSRFTHEEAKEKLRQWYDTTDVPRWVFDLIEGKEPTFITFTQTT